MVAEHHCHPQTSKLLSVLPTELLDLILAPLSTRTLLSLRSTCRLASRRVDASFRKLLSTRKYFIHPYSLGLLTALSESRFAPSVKRIIICTETFSELELRLRAAECTPTFTEAFQRFKNLTAIKICDFPTPRLSEDPGYGYRCPTPDAASDDPPPRFNSTYHARWGEEPDNLHSQGVAHVAVEEGHGRWPNNMPYNCSIFHNPQWEMCHLFRAVLKSCSIAKELAGVEVKDFRVALGAVEREWALEEDEFKLFDTDGDVDVNPMILRFLQSLEVLHLPLQHFHNMHPPRHLCRFLSACSRVKWLRLEFQQGGFPGIPDFLPEFTETMCVAKWDLDRLDLGCALISPHDLLDLLALFKPTILNLSDVNLMCGESVDDRNVWLEAMQGAAQWVKHVTLADVRQSTYDHSYNRYKHVYFLPDMKRILELELSRNGEVVQESLDRLDSGLVAYEYRHTYS